MTSVLLKVDYTGNENYWSESTITNKVFQIDEKKDIHNQIAEILKENDYCELSYGAKPKSNVCVDTKEGVKFVGYVYRDKQDIEGKRANFDVWVTIRKVIDFEIKEIEY